MAKKSSFREARERRDVARAKSQEPSAFPTVKLLLVPRKIGQPVEVARLLTSYGMSLRKAHDTLNRLADRKVVAAELHADDCNKLGSELSSLGIDARFIRELDIDVKRV